MGSCWNTCPICSKDMEDCKCPDHKNIGSKFDDFLEKEGILNNSMQVAAKRISSYANRFTVDEGGTCTECERQYDDLSNCECPSDDCPSKERQMKITVNFDNFTEDTYDSMKEAEEAILENHADGVSVDYVWDENENPLYCTWKVKLHKEP